MAAVNSITKPEHPVLAGLQAERALDSREAPAPMHDDEEGEWNPAVLTAAPPARAGFSQRWIRSSAMGVEDVPHLMRKRNEGWEPRQPETVPHGYFAPIVAHASMGNVISNGDMILMERPVRKTERQREAIEKMTRLQTGAIERYLGQHIPGGKGFGQGEVSEFDRKVTTGKRPRIADD